MNRTSRPLLMATIASVVAVTGASALGMAASAAPAAAHHSHAKHSLQGLFAASGSSFASELQIGNTIRSARSALTEVGCGSDDTKSAAATPDINLAGLGTLGSVSTNTDTMDLAGPAVKTVTGSVTSQISLLGGIIQAKSLSSNAWAQHIGTSTVGGATEFVDATVLGLPIPLAPQPNTVIPLPGIGSLTLNGQKLTNHAGILNERVTGLALRITTSLPKLPAGTTLILGRSAASVTHLTSGPVGGEADGDQAVVPGLLNSGQTFRNYLPCNGTKGKVLTDSGAGINLGQLLTTGVVHTTVRGVGGATPKSITSATIANVSLLGGLVKAHAVRARALVEKIKGQAALVRNSDGSGLVGLTIAGKTINVGKIAPNTKYNLAGIGTLWLDRTNRTARRVGVHMIELDLGTTIDGYNAGTVLTIGDAIALIKS